MVFSLFYGTYQSKNFSLDQGYIGGIFSNDAEAKLFDNFA